MSEKNDILVQVDHLKKYFPVKGVHGPGVQAVEDVSLLHLNMKYRCLGHSFGLCLLLFKLQL